MSQLQASVITGILPKIIDEGKNNIVAQSRFLKEINKAKAKNNINPNDRYQPFTVDENNTGFGVVEGGAILGGQSPEYAMTQIGLRSHWASMNWTGSVERIKDKYLTKLQRDPRYESHSLQDLAKIARNFAVRDLVFSTLKMYARRENFFALQGGDNSAIGTVTAANSGTDIATFDPATTSSGNRLFGKGQQIEFRSPAGALRDANITAGYMTVDQRVVKDSAGQVHFDALGTDVAIGDTAHLRNSYGAMPVGVPFYVDDAGEYKGLARSTNPEIFSSVRIRNTGSPTIGPIHVRELLTKMQSKMGYDIPMELVFWLNKCQLFNWETGVYGALIRQAGAGEVQKADLAIDEVAWGGRRFNIDVDVPPDALDALNMATWGKTTQTELQAYEFDSGSLVVNVVNSEGQRLDAKQTTIFSEYNWDCDDPRSNGISDGFAYNVDYI